MARIKFPEQAFSINISEMRHLTIETRVRPGRVAVFVDINEPQWQGTCLRVIEYFTRLWGGCGNIIVPTDGKVISPLFWRILERFDPDYVRAYARTGQDIEIEEPAKFEQAYQRGIAAWERQISAKTDQNAAKTIRDNLRHSVLTPFGISPELQQELRDRLAPFHFQQWIVEAGSLSAGSIPHHPHTDVADILPYAEHSSRVLRVSDAAPFPQLWWASSFGSVNPELQAQLAKANVAVYEYGRSEDEVKLLINLAVKGYEEIESARFLTNTSVNAMQEILQSAAMRLSMIGLGYYRSIRHQDATEAVIAVAGARIEDFALYYALARMRSRVVWIPPSVLDQLLGPASTGLRIDPAWHFVNDLASLARGDTQRYAGLTLLSVTLTPDQLDQVKARLSDVAVNGISQCQIVKPAQVIPAQPIRHYETNNVSDLRSFAVPEDGMIRLFETPLPQSFAEVNPSKHRWLTELNIRQYEVPRHYVLGESMMGSSSFTTKDVRISSNGPTYFCPSWLILGGASAESSVPRPTIHIPEPLEIFRDVARPTGLSCAISDKGFYAENACQKFGGLDRLAAFLRSRSGQLFTLAFLDKTKPEEDDHLKGVLLSDKRRYFDLDSLAATLGSETEAAQMLDRLSSAAVLYRGFILQCQYCRRADWFPLRELSDSFTCKRCHREQVFTQKHWRHPNQPHLYYQLDELVYLGLEHNMQVPLLALDTLRGARDSFLYVHELEYREKDKDTPMLEVDLNCIADGVLTIGEAKKDDRLGKNDKEDAEAISKQLELARRLCAQRIVFATGSEEWHPSTRERILKAFGDQRFDLVFLARKQLYGEQSI
ncbi:MAG TPA: hypothetical protein VJX69_14600 [Terriglobales bacterium]|nr:hypothetical protein [Terriglobales bacterium]